MTITVDLYQDSGAVSSGHGTTRISVNNVGWKNSGLDETNSFVYYPLIRPEVTPFGYSFTMYNYLKISGTYPKGSRMRLRVSGAVDGAPPSGYVGTDKVRLFYKLTNTYTTPSNAFDGSLIYLPPGVAQTLYPRISTVGPEAATSYTQYMSANTTYYTEYLVTQLFVEAGSVAEFGNIGQLNIKVFMDEYEDTDT